MANDVASILMQLLATNRGFEPTNPEARPMPDYGVAGLLVGDVLQVTLTFKQARAYCCMEWGCHLGLFDGKRWSRLHQALADSGVPAAARLRLQLTCKVEAGALFFDVSQPDHSRRGWYAFAPAEQLEYTVTATEADTK